MAISLGIVEDHSEFRQSLIYLVSSFSDYSVKWSFGSVEEALDNFSDIDVLLLDISLPKMAGNDSIPLFKNLCPDLKVIMLTIQEDPNSILKAIQNGADGYILKKTHPQKILEAIQQVRDGGAPITPLVARQVFSFLKTAPGKGINEAKLTSREIEILTLITQGFSTEIIAEKLFISIQTVRNHIKNIYDKLQVHSKAQAVAKALNEKLV
ncbi:MAG: response regulator transcription factor [Bacteroidetes bacterium]|nr:response regulator transcription factor [Bacteroidota bacterium]